MTDFGDYDPEDAWDANDPLREQTRQLLHRLDLETTRRTSDPRRLDRLVVDLLSVVHRMRSRNGQ